MFPPPCMCCIIRPCLPYVFVLEVVSYCVCLFCFGIFRFLSDPVLVAFLVALIKYPDNSNLKKKGFILAHSCRLVASGEATAAGT